MGRLKRRDPIQAEAYKAWRGAVPLDYADCILPVGADAAEEWRRLSMPNSVSVVGGLMAAMAKVRGMTLVTRNTVDVARTGVRLLNPFGTGR